MPKIEENMSKWSWQSLYFTDYNQPSIAILSFAITIILYIYHNYYNSQDTINVTLKRLVIVADHSRFNPL